ncbi:hypothetical protein Tco_0240455, partial [Tanacetum coccineum]
MLGTYEQVPDFKMKVSKRWLKDTFETVPKEISGDAIAPYVRGPAMAKVAYRLDRWDKNVKGPMWIVEFFFLERIPKIANLIMGIGSSEEKTVSLFGYWSPRMVSP